jgi:hypothetical protein
MSERSDLLSLIFEPAIFLDRSTVSTIALSPAGDHGQVDGDWKRDGKRESGGQRHREDFSWLQP